VVALDPELVLFDLDGTLVDSATDIAAAADDMMRALQRPAPGEERVRAWVGNGIERLVHRCLTGDMHADAAPALLDRAMALFHDAYTRHNGLHSRLYPGVTEGLAAAEAHGARLGCVTNKSRRYTEPLLRGLGLLSRFQVLVCGDTAAQRKPDPAPLLHALAAMELAARRALLVGDSESDVRAARAAGMPVVCVSYGYNHGRDIADSSPDAVLDTLAELGEVLRRGGSEAGDGDDGARAS
jgi:phosphoglycolate phosphatase